MKKTVLFFLIPFFIFLMASPFPVYAIDPALQNAEYVWHSQGAAAAIPLFQKLAENGEPNSMIRLGFIYKHETNIETRYAESAKWYKNFLQFSYFPEDYKCFSMYELGQLYMSGGYGLDRDLAQSRNYFDNIVEMGWAGKMGWTDKNISTLPSVDLTVAIGKYMEGNTINDSDYLKAGKLLVKNKPKDALAPLKQSAENKNFDAMEVLGVMYKYGIGVRQDYFEAASWFRKAAEKELPYSMLNMGKLYDKGLGLTQDDATAREWYKRSALAGNEEAKTILTKKIRKDPLAPEAAIEMVGLMRYSKDGLPWGEAVNKLILKPKWEYYFNESEGHVVKLRGYYEDAQKEKQLITIWYVLKCEPNIEDGSRSLSIKHLLSAVNDEKPKDGIPNWLAYEVE